MRYKQFVICIGAEKAGTTTLHSLFEEHPEILVSSQKETGFFYDDDLFAKGFDWYMGTYFSDVSNQKILFEADPNYCYFSKCIERLCQCIPDTKLVFILRNPVRRAFSQYLMMKKWGLEPLDFEQACAAEPERISKGDWQKSHFGYLDRSDYLRQIKEVLDAFPRRQIYFVKFEDFIANQKAEYNKILEWLGLNSIDIHVEKHANKSSVPRIRILSQIIHHPRYRKARQWISSSIGQKRALNIKANLEKLLYTNRQIEKLSPETYDYLWKRFFGDMDEIEILTGLDLSSWKDRNQ